MIRLLFGSARAKGKTTQEEKSRNNSKYSSVLHTNDIFLVITATTPFYCMCGRKALGRALSRITLSAESRGSSCGVRNDGGKIRTSTNQRPSSKISSTLSVCSVIGVCLWKYALAVVSESILTPVISISAGVFSISLAESDISIILLNTGIVVSHVPLEEYSAASFIL